MGLEYGALLAILTIPPALIFIYTSVFNSFFSKHLPCKALKGLETIWANQFMEKCMWVMTYLCPFLLARCNGVCGNIRFPLFVLCIGCIRPGYILTKRSTVSNLEQIHIRFVFVDDLDCRFKYLPYWAAKSNAVSPLVFLMLGSQRCSNNSFTTAVCPYWAAQCKAVSSSLVWKKWVT